MPENNNNQNNDDKGGTPPADPKDQNNGGGDGGNPVDGQPNGGQGGEEETVTMKKSELTKMQSDLDNYRKATISDNNRPLPNGNDNKPGGAAPDNGAGAGSPQLDEKRVQEIATQTSMGVVHKNNEREAKKVFFERFPEYIESTAWQELVPFYSPRSGKDEVQNILDDLEDAVLAHKRRTGKLGEHLENQRQEAQRQAEINARMNMGRDGGSTGNRTNSGGANQKIDESTVQMGQNFKHSREKLEEVANAIPNTPEGFVLDVTKKK